MTGPNVNAGPADVANKIDGINPATGTVLPYRIAAMFYDAHMFGLPKDYAFPEGSNVSASLADQTTTLTKLLTRKQKLVDGNDYDVWDCIFTITKFILSQAPHINDDEVNSVGYKKPSA